MRNFDRIDSWLDAALRLWAKAGQCPRTGAFHECLTLDGEPRADVNRRVRVQFRQIYVFAHAAALGLDPHGVDRARAGFEYVARHGWAPDGRPGWAHVLTPEGGVADARRDTYDQVFALLGLSWYFRVSGDPRAAQSIRETLDVLDRSLRAPNGGFLESDAGCWPRRQNPHMHAFEAMMSLFEATGEYGYLARAGEQYGLFATHFFDPSRGLLFEFFDRDWRRLSAEEEQRIEPGHMAEWVWLLREYERLSGRAVDMDTDPLFRKVLEIGFEPSGRFLVDGMSVDGAVTAPSRRLWPQTELLKAALAQYRATNNARYRKVAERTLDAIFDEYLKSDALGGWLDKFEGSGAVATSTIPASTFYHLFCALAAAREILPAPAVAPVFPDRAREEQRIGRYSEPLIA